MSIKFSPNLLRLWMFANAEAWFCQSIVIEPAHFWIGCLKLTDPKLADALAEQGAPVDARIECTREAARILAFLEMDATTAATRRRQMRARLLRGQPPRKFPDGDLPMFHRSESSRRLFEIASRKAAERQEAHLSPLHILESLFEMKLVSLESL